MKKNEITIICQNLNNWPKKNRTQPKDYMGNKKYKADYYAFQEYPLDNKRGFSTRTFDQNGNELASNDSMKSIWEQIFLWKRPLNGYWHESLIEIFDEKITLINIHISTTYSDQLKLILYQRLIQLEKEKEKVLIVGDFNAAFKDQTEEFIEENDKFLSLICENGYSEILGKDEDSKNPHHTFAIKNQKTEEWLKKKLDHVFVSAALKEYPKLTISLEYLDEVNYNLDHISNKKSQNGISDHTGIKITVSQRSTYNS